MELYDEIFKLKNLIRRGWQIKNVEGRLESDAEHTFSMIILALEIMNKNNLKLNELKVLKMVAYHELCEIDAGDTTPYDGVTKQEKFDKEYMCIKRLAKQYDMPEIENIWLEFEKNETPEAKFVKCLDKYDSVLQSKIYSNQQQKPDIYEEFKNQYKSICEEMDKLKR